MMTTSKSNSAGHFKYSYRSIAAKLSSCVEVNHKARVVSSFAYTDPVRNIANLMFIKQFGIVPLDIISRNGEMEIDKFEKLEGYDGPTIFIESLFLSEVESGSDVASNNMPEKMFDNVIKPNFKQSVEVGLYDLLSERYIKAINQQTKIVTSLIETKRQELKGGYIYISGFSIVSPVNSPGNLMAEPEYFPWYFELGDNSGKLKTLAQPELNVYIRSLIERPPLITNLDDFLDNINSAESSPDSLS